MKDIFILHLETSTKVCSAALSKNGQLLALQESNDEIFSHGEKLTLFVQSVLEQTRIEMKDLSAVSIASGPGSYTGLRIGASTAKGFCYALGIPLLAIDTLESLQNNARLKYPNATLCAMIDARRMEVYSAFYSKDSTILKTVSADILDETTYQEFEPFVCFGDGMPKLRELWANREITFDEEIICSATGQIQRVYDKYQNQEFEDLAYFEPFYLKDFIGIPAKNKV